MDLFRLLWQSISPRAAGGGGGASATFAETVIAMSPTGYWRLGEASGNVADSSGNAHTLTVGGSPVYGEAGWPSDDDGAILFDGLTDYFSDGVETWPDVGTSDFSVMWAMKLSVWPDNDEAFILCHDGGGGTGTWYVKLKWDTANRVNLFIYDVEFDLDGTSLADNAWHLMIVAVDRSGNATLYQDGAAVDTVDVSSKVASNVATSANFMLGADQGNAFGYILGTLDEVAFWKSYLITSGDAADLYAARNGAGGGGGSTQADVYDAAVMAFSPIAFFKLDEDSGTVMSDASATNNDGTFNGTLTYGVTGPFTGAKAITFTATSWGQAPSHASLSVGTSDFSIVVWIKRTTTSPGDQWMLARDGCYELATWWEDEDKFGTRLTNTGWALSDGTDALDDNAWHMIAMTCDRNGNATFYVDAVADGTTDISSDVATDLSSSVSVLYVARRLVDGHGWVGTMSRPAIFASLLSGANITTLYTAGGY